MSHQRIRIANTRDGFLTPDLDFESSQAVVAGVLDNLGKGASGQAVQNLNLMCGLDEDAGLDPAPTMS